jgi:hypothetical protein
MVGFANTTLKRGASNHCAYGAGDKLPKNRQYRTCGLGQHCAYGAGDKLVPIWNDSHRPL